MILRNVKPRRKVSRGVLARRVLSDLDGAGYRRLGYAVAGYQVRVNGNRLEFVGRMPGPMLLARCMRYQPEIVAILTEGKADTSRVPNSLRDLIEQGEL